VKITPLDIQQQQFKGNMFGGLDSADVDAFLQTVSGEMEDLIRENTELKEQARKDAEAAIAAPLDVYRGWFLDGQTFIGGDTPSIADMRFAATLEFLRAIDYDFPAWAEEYMAAMESALGAAYSEPAADVRGYIDYVRSQSG
jgi:DivIVA domain-containing protein